MFMHHALVSADSLCGWDFPVLVGAGFLVRAHLVVMSNIDLKAGKHTILCAPPTFP